MKDSRKAVMRGKKLSGVVLIMIITVMSMLIVLLLATLTVVSSARARYYTKYEENQAYYTARSALDVVTQSMLIDKGNYAYKSDNTNRMMYDYTDETGNHSVPMKQGLAMQIELHKITSQAKWDDSTSTYNRGILENMTSAAYTAASSTPYEAWKQDKYFCIDNSGIDSVTYTVQLPDTSKNDGTRELYGSIKGSDISSAATVKVEVLRREYAMESSFREKFILLPDDKKETLCGGTNVTYTIPGTSPAVTVECKYTDLIDAIRKGDRSKDVMRIKITSTATFNGITQSAVLIYDNTDPPIVTGSEALKNTGGGTLNGNNFKVDGPVSANGDVNWANDQGFDGAPYFGGKLTMAPTNAKFGIDENKCFYVGGDFDNSAGGGQNYYANDVKTVSKETRPYVYVGGDFKTQNGTKIGGTEDKDKVDLVVKGNITLTSNNFDNSGGDIYCKGDIKLTSGSDQKLSNNIFCGGVFRATQPVWNNCTLYCDGGIYVGPGTGITPTILDTTITYLEMPPGLTLYLGPNAKFYVHTDSGDIEYTQSETLTGSAAGDLSHGTFGGVYGKAGAVAPPPGEGGGGGEGGEGGEGGGEPPAPEGGEPVPLAETPEGVPEFTSIFTNDAFPADPDVTEIKLPKGVKIDGTFDRDGLEKTLPTKKTSDTNYAKLGTDGNPVVSGGNVVIVTAEERFFTPGSAEVGTYVSDKGFNATDMGASTVISTKGTYGPGNYIMNAVELNTADGFGSSTTIANTVYFQGSGKVNVLMTGGTYSGLIVADDAIDLNLCVPQNKTIEFSSGHNFMCVTKSTFDALCKNPAEDIYAGVSGAKLRVPNIHYYLGAGAKLKTPNRQHLLEGYVYGPDATIEVNAPGVAMKIKYNGGTAQNKNVFILGAAVVKQYDSQQSGAGNIVFINPEASSVPAGDPPLNFKAGRYQYK